MESPCPVCRGSGSVPLAPYGENPRDCAECAGKGFLGSRSNAREPCPACRGVGLLIPGMRSRAGTHAAWWQQNRRDSAEFDVVISFAGEDRAVVERYAERLQDSGLCVFYDEFERVDLWGKDLVVALSEVYQKRARFCAIFISQHYARKAWTNLEHRAAQARALRQHQEYILPVRLDDTELPGLLETVSYIDLRSVGLDELVQTTLAKVRGADR